MLLVVVNAVKVFFLIVELHDFKSPKKLELFVTKPIIPDHLFVDHLL